MSFFERLFRSNFFIKLKSWEYWPFGIVQLPLFVYFAWLSLRSRSFLFFTASNPGIAMGGMFGESKYDVLRKIPPRYTPRTVKIEAPATVAQVMAMLRAHGFTFPVIFKPDIGERGFMVKRIDNEADVERYLARMRFDFLVQAFVDLPAEFAVFYTRLPGQQKGYVNSVTAKEMLSVTGDGRATLQQLILAKDRAKLQWHALQKAYAHRLDNVIAAGEKIELVSIGNHCLGTTFLDGTHLITEKLSETFDHISQQIEGFYFGRFDLRCASVADLYAGNVMIMELNGCGAEPAHIYQPGYSLRKALGVLFTHWRNIFIIARENNKRGVAFTPYREALAYYRKFKQATQPV